MENMELVAQLPTLYSFSSKDKIKQWSIAVERCDFDGLIYLRTRHGYVGQIITETYSSEIKGKNLGKKNETLPEEQAISEAKSKWQKKVDKNYSKTIPTDRGDYIKLRPMLAQNFEDRSHHIKYPCYMQPKLDGVRTLMSRVEDTMTFTSRGDKEYTTVDHIKMQIKRFFSGDVILDGEIYQEGTSLQQINSAVKKKCEESQDLEFWVFDIADITLPFKDRLAILNGMAKALESRKWSHIKIVPTVRIESEEQLKKVHAKFSENYEGSTIRNEDGMYVFDYRSNDLQKLKDFITDEFEIIGGKEGHGNDEGTVVFRCKTKDGKEFDVRPIGTREQRREWFKDLPNLIEKFLTVKFQQYSDDGIPIFPVGITIRDYE